MGIFRDRMAIHLRLVGFSSRTGWTRGSYLVALSSSTCNAGQLVPPSALDVPAKATRAIVVAAMEEPHHLTEQRA